MNKTEKNIYHKKVHEKSPSQLSTVNLLWQNPILTFFHIGFFPFGSHTTFVFKIVFVFFKALTKMFLFSMPLL